MKAIIALKENKDFRRLYTRGKSYVSPVLVTYVMKSREKNTRVGITTSKKTGNAVKRSRSRRVIREAYRRLQPQVKDGFDLVFVARAKTPYTKSTELMNVIYKQLNQAGVLK